MHNEAKKEVENLTQKILENISRKDLKIFIKVLKQIEDNLK